MKLLLASSSPYRKQLLERFRLPFECAAPEIDETSLPDEDAAELAERLSVEKAQVLASRFPRHLIIGSDQTAICGEKIYTKPGDLNSAERQLEELSGKTVLFHSGLCVLNSVSQEISSAVVTTSVRFRVLDKTTTRRYLEREKPFDCVGSFKAEGLGIALFDSIHSDDPTALMGLPLIRLSHLLELAGLPVI